MKKMTFFTLTLLILSTIGLQTAFAQVTLEGHTDYVWSVSFSPDGTTLASGASDDEVKLWDVATKQNIATLQGHRDNVRSVSFSPDGTTLASGSSDDTVKLWDVATGTNTATLDGHTSSVTSVSFSPDGTTFASGSGDGTSILWDMATDTNIATLEGHTDWVQSVSFSPDGTTLASGSYDGTVKLWNVATKQNIATLQGHTRSVFSVSFSPDGTTLASGSSDSTVKLWDVATRTNIATLQANIATLQGGRNVVYSVSFSPDGTILVSGSTDGTVKLWNVATHTNIATLGERTWAVLSVSFSPDGTTLASGSSDSTVKLWDVSEWMGPRPHTLVKISGDEQQGMSGSALANPLIVEVRDQYDNPLPDVKVTFRVTAGYGNLSGHSTVEHATTDANGRAEAILTLGPIPGTNTVGVSLGLRGFATFNAVGVGTPDMPSNYWTWHLPDSVIARLGKGSIESVAFLPDGQRLIVASEIGVWLYDVATSRELALLPTESRVGAFSPHGTILAVLLDDTVKLWDVTTGTNIATLEGHTDWVNSVAFSPDGTTLASGSYGITRLNCGTWRRAQIPPHLSGMSLVSLLCRFHPMGQSSLLEAVRGGMRMVR